MDIFPTAVAERCAAYFRLLGDPTRLRMVQALAEGERTVSELAEIVQTTMPNASKHLLQLAQSGLVRRRRESASVFYELADREALMLIGGAFAAVCRALDDQMREIAAPEPAQER